MIGNFYPLVVASAVTVGAVLATAAVRSTSAATEIANDVVWLVEV